MGNIWFYKRCPHCSGPLCFRMCFKSDPSERSGCRSKSSPGGGEPQVSQTFPLSTVRSQCGLECASKLTACRGQGKGPSWWRTSDSTDIGAAPSTTPSQCGLECASHVTPSRGQVTGPNQQNERANSSALKGTPWRCQGAGPNQTQEVGNLWFYKHWRPALLRARVVKNLLRKEPVGEVRV